MQVAIDNAKRRFDIDLTEEIKRIKKDMNIKENGYPAFWTVIKKGFNKSKVNNNLVCPMNYIFNIEINKFRASSSTLPMDTFFIKYELDQHRRKSKKVEEFIQKYSLDLYNNLQNNNNDDDSDYFVLRNDYDKLLEDISQIYVSKNYLGLMSWLIDRAFNIGSGVRSKSNVIQTHIDQNKAILLKVLYGINSASLLKCFRKNIDKVDND